MNLVSLSEENTYQIFSCLGPKDLLKCNGVCTTWRRIASDDNLWKKLLPPSATHPKSDIKNYVLTHMVKSENDILRFKRVYPSVLFSFNPSLYIDNLVIREGWIKDTNIWISTPKNESTHHLKSVKVNVLSTHVSDRTKIVVILSIFVLCLYILRQQEI